MEPTTDEETTKRLAIVMLEDLGISRRNALKLDGAVVNVNLSELQKQRRANNPSTIEFKIAQENKEKVSQWNSALLVRDEEAEALDHSHGMGSGQTHRLRMVKELYGDKPHKGSYGASHAQGTNNFQGKPKPAYDTSFTNKRVQISPTRKLAENPTSRYPNNKASDNNKQDSLQPTIRLPVARTALPTSKVVKQESYQNANDSMVRFDKQTAANAHNNTRKPFQSLGDSMHAAVWAPKSTIDAINSATLLRPAVAKSSKNLIAGHLPAKTLPKLPQVAKYDQIVSSSVSTNPVNFVKTQSQANAVSKHWTVGTLATPAQFMASSVAVLGLSKPSVSEVSSSIPQSTTTSVSTHSTDGTATPKIVVKLPPLTKTGHSSLPKDATALQPNKARLQTIEEKDNYETASNISIDIQSKSIVDIDIAELETAKDNSTNVNRAKVNTLEIDTTDSGNNENEDPKDLSLIGLSSENSAALKNRRSSHLLDLMELDVGDWQTGPTQAELLSIQSWDKKYFHEEPEKDTTTLLQKALSPARTTDAQGPSKTGHLFNVSISHGTKEVTDISSSTQSSKNPVACSLSTSTMPKSVLLEPKGISLDYSPIQSVSDFPKPTFIEDSKTNLPLYPPWSKPGLDNAYQRTFQGTSTIRPGGSTKIESTNGTKNSVAETLMNTIPPVPVYPESEKIIRQSATILSTANKAIAALNASTPRFSPDTPTISNANSSTLEPVVNLPARARLVFPNNDDQWKYLIASMNKSKAAATPVVETTPTTVFVPALNTKFVSPNTGTMITNPPQSENIDASAVSNPSPMTQTALPVPPATARPVPAPGVSDPVVYTPVVPGSVVSALVVPSLVVPAKAVPSPVVHAKAIPAKDNISVSSLAPKTNIQGWTALVNSQKRSRK
ncbi:MAG: hypothetical protein M1829_004253 [Trizodia sp. TS-e1964]|nr:MAG: hypothetical protein M1829_004253 [Trizodia sp. TS-e1964]